MKLKHKSEIEQKVASYIKEFFFPKEYRRPLKNDYFRKKFTGNNVASRLGVN